MSRELTKDTSKKFSLWVFVFLALIAFQLPFLAVGLIELLTTETSSVSTFIHRLTSSYLSTALYQLDVFSLFLILLYFLDRQVRLNRMSVLFIPLALCCYLLVGGFVVICRGLGGRFYP